MNNISKVSLIKKISFLIIIIIAFGSVACGKKETEANKVEVGKEEYISSGEEVEELTDGDIEIANDTRILLAAKGYVNPQVLIEDGRVKVTIYADSLSDQQYAIIENTVKNETGFEIENIDIEVTSTAE